MLKIIHPENLILVSLLYKIMVKIIMNLKYGSSSRSKKEFLKLKNSKLEMYNPIKKKSITKIDRMNSSLE